MCLSTTGVGMKRRLGKRPCQDCHDCTFNGGDLYARPVNLTLPSGRTHYNTCAGGCISFFVVLLIFIAILVHLNELMDENSHTIQQVIARDWFSDTDVFPGRDDQKDAIQVAFGLVDIEDWQGDVNLYDSQMIEINFYERFTVPDSKSFKYEKLEIGECEDEELGLEVSDTITRSRTL